MRRFAVVGLLSRIWALRDNLAAYDATYVALAEAVACDLLMADARLARAPGPTCPITRPDLPDHRRAPLTRVSDELNVRQLALGSDL